jgi:hypothetical protein
MRDSVCAASALPAAANARAIAPLARTGWQSLLSAAVAASIAVCHSTLHALRRDSAPFMSILLLCAAAAFPPSWTTVLLSRSASASCIHPGLLGPPWSDPLHSGLHPGLHSEPVRGPILDSAAAIFPLYPAVTLVCFAVSFCFHDPIRSVSLLRSAFAPRLRSHFLLSIRVVPCVPRRE